jgi:malonyl-CoA/methylmalonyl-CoA synthetase
MSENLFNSLFAAARADQPAIRGEHGASVSYGDLLAASGRIANALVSFGVVPGDRVAAQVEKSRQALELYLGVLRAGGVFLPLNTAYTLNELAYFIGDAEPALIVCDPSVADGVETLPGCSGKVLTLDPLGCGTLMDLAGTMAGDFATVARTGTDLAAILYTSGTTGRAKGAMLSHGNLIANAEVLRSTWRFTDRDILLHTLPIYHAHGLFVAVNVTLLCGASMYFLPGFNPDGVLALMPQSTAMMGVPTFYVRLLDDPRLPEAARVIRLFISGSAPLLPETHRAWRDVTGHTILERYGMTETTMLTSNPYDGDRIPGSVGLPLAGVEVRVVDPETGIALAVNDIGMIEVKGPNVFAGYWRQPEKTTADFRPDGFFITGDLGRIDERGYLYIVGRGKDLVITGGLNVYPREVEAEIDEIPGVAESAVIGVAHPDFGEGVTAIVTCKRGVVLTEREIIVALGDRLSRFKQPKRVIFVDELPRNAMGKVQKNALRQRYGSLYATAKPEKEG